MRISDWSSDVCSSDLDTGDGVELVEGVVEAQLGDGGAGDRREQGAPQRIAQRVAEAGLQRADREALTVVLGLADRLDGGALDDEHVVLPRDSVAAGGRGWGRSGDYLEYSSTMSCSRTGTSICSRSGSSRTVI